MTTLYIQNNRQYKLMLVFDTRTVCRKMMYENLLKPLKSFPNSPKFKYNGKGHKLVTIH